MKSKEEKQKKINLYYKAQRAWKQLLTEVAINDGAKLYQPWKHFPSFRQWYEGNYYETESNKLTIVYNLEDRNCLDISPQTCVLVPSEIVTKINYLYKVYPLDSVSAPNGMFQMPFKEFMETYYLDLPTEVYDKLYHFQRHLEKLSNLQ